MPRKESSAAKGNAKVETFDVMVAKANSLKNAALKRKKKAGALEEDKPKPTKKQKDTLGVARHVKDKKKANFKGHGKVNAAKQMGAKAAQRERMLKKLAEKKQKAEEEASDDEDEDEDAGDEDHSDEDDASAEKEAEKAMEAEMEQRNSDQGDETDDKCVDKDDTETVEQLKKQFLGKKVLTKEEREEEEERERRIDEEVQRRKERQLKQIAERQTEQKNRRQKKRRKLKGNQANRVGDNYMPFLSVGF